jgi:YVTN family beta-propeller protein
MTCSAKALVVAVLLLVACCVTRVAHGAYTALPITVNGITTVAGGGSVAGTTGDGGKATSAALGKTYNVAPDTQRNLVYMVDADNKAIRKLNVTTGIISTVSMAGTALTGPYDIALEAGGLSLLVCDSAAYCVRRITAPYSQSTVVTTVAGVCGTFGTTGDGGLATLAHFRGPYGLGINTRNGDIFVTDTFAQRVKLVTVATGIMTTVASVANGLRNPVGVCVDGARQVGTLSTWLIIHALYCVVLAAPRLTFPFSLQVAYVPDGTNNTIKAINTTTLTVSTIVTGLLNPWRCTISSTGFVFFTDSNAHQIKYLDIVTHAVTAIAGTGALGSTGDGGPASAAKLYYPDGLALDEEHGFIYLADTYNKKVRAIQGSFSRPFPTSQPTRQPTEQPTAQPSGRPSGRPSRQPSAQPTTRPSSQPTEQPTARPSRQPLSRPTTQPSTQPSHRTYLFWCRFRTMQCVTVFDSPLVRRRRRPHKAAPWPSHCTAVAATAQSSECAAVDTTEPTYVLPFFPDLLCMSHVRRVK